MSCCKAAMARASSCLTDVFTSQLIVPTAVTSQCIGRALMNELQAVKCFQSNLLLCCIRRDVLMGQMGDTRELKQGLGLNIPHAFLLFIVFPKYKNALSIYVASSGETAKFISTIMIEACFYNVTSFIFVPTKGLSMFTFFSTMTHS